MSSNPFNILDMENEHKIQEIIHNTQEIKHKVQEIKQDPEHKITKQYIPSIIRLKGNIKSLLCKTIISGEQCKYDKKCSYAHSIEEQHKNEIRIKCYDMISGKFDLSTIDLYKDTKILSELLILTNICENCIKNKCQGGYNCRRGVYDKKLQICISDLINGYCNAPQCPKVHLSKFGLIHFDIIKCINEKL